MESGSATLGPAHTGAFCVTPAGVAVRYRRCVLGFWVSWTPVSGELRALSPGVAVGDGQDIVPGLLLALDVPGRVNHLHKGVAPVDDRTVRARFDELGEEQDVLRGVPQGIASITFLSRLGAVATARTRFCRRPVAR